ncbi:ATP synthase-coupling factor 6, mitochondrial-like [Pollicipes pollicipes]|uniref:ATP synthase-coupling factor 6, mitochondrial-like n=1 Tax=Pollicipes pollicipes TaxID=41117 RepID=UPI0018851A1A|nr:ATP synthase-coupling factor 6, mitochondrial-like [Pollicipes pollicipes]XP_037071858.1 ATP synthase-coupling factor 6, mitochondrial-like [Pollicipes pollicipes]XP_037072452.1 ATP synthase-coupling factor 6, mitochondrial-like [Pollicipes pollicipes]XP_037072453.1 ATP synthase-coupling factor 6, mitochondrial-like [Pollicipes pollicipes]
MSQLARPLRQAAASLRLARHINTSAALGQTQANDPIQKLFLEKLRAYGSKSKTAKDGLVDPTPQLQAEMKNELERIARSYGFKEGEDVAKFPQFNFPEPTVDPISSKQA